jgi:hypothetical protein
MGRNNFPNVPVNANGIPSFSPGLLGTSYPGLSSPTIHQPCKGWIAICRGTNCFNPFRVEKEYWAMPPAYSS